MEIKYEKTLPELNDQIRLGKATSEDKIEFEARKDHLRQVQIKQQNKQIL